MIVSTQTYQLVEEYKLLPKLTVAKTTVTSSSLPPLQSIYPLSLAFLAKGDRKFSSLDSCLAKNAMELQHCCIFTKSLLHPFRLSICSTKRPSGTLSKTPSVAKTITSPSSTLNSYLSAASGRSLKTSEAISEGGKLSWNGVLK